MILKKLVEGIQTYSGQDSYELSKKSGQDSTWTGLESPDSDLKKDKLALQNWIMIMKGTFSIQIYVR